MASFLTLSLLLVILGWNIETTQHFSKTCPTVVSVVPFLYQCCIGEIWLFLSSHCTGSPTDVSRVVYNFIRVYSSLGLTYLYLIEWEKIARIHIGDNYKCYNTLELSGRYSRPVLGDWGWLCSYLIIFPHNCLRWKKRWFETVAGVTVAGSLTSHYESAVFRDWENFIAL